MNRAFKGIWIPKNIWLDEDLTIMEKVFLVEIDSLDNEQGCFASNGYFADFFKISKGRCTQIIKGLEAKGYLTIEYQKEGKEIKKRTLRVVNKLNTPIKNIKHPYLENDEGSNTSLNNTKDIVKVDLDLVSEIIEYLNEKAEREFRPNSQKTKRLVSARLGEGFKKEDFFHVIDAKVKDWKFDEQMNKYLRPETLFGTKFEGYLNEVPYWKKKEPEEKKEEGFSMDSFFDSVNG